MASVRELYPEYQGTAILDKLRATEYGYLDAQKHVYLDYTGSGLASKAQFNAHSQRLAGALLGNPHSSNPTSEAATSLIEQTRSRVLEHLNASEVDYVVIFTPNATAAARLVGEAYPFSWSKKLILTSDNHNSINGLREFARHAGSRVKYIHSGRSDLRIETAAVRQALGGKSAPFCRPYTLTNRHKGLFAFPAQSNFSGVRHPLSWIQMAQDVGYDVLLDAAAYLPTGSLDLSAVKPQFVTVSWYKVFGYPTGLGCLIARRDALSRLKRPWFSGGTVQAVSVGAKWHAMAPNEAAFEDGTLNFLSIPDISFGINWLVGIGQQIIDTRVRCLTGYFIGRLKEMRHSNGKNMIKIYGPDDLTLRGGTVCFNFIDSVGQVVDERLVAAESAAVRISLRTGCFCNPGAGEDAFGLGRKKLLRLLWSNTTSIDQYIKLTGLPSGGAIRVSFGLVSNCEDLNHFFAFAEKAYKDRTTSSKALPPRGQR